MSEESALNKMNTPTIRILLSTYNGEQYLREQLNSIFGQKGVVVDLCVRDDGSTDGTVRILDEYRKKGYPIHIRQGENIGACASYMDLLWSAETDSRYYAFSDQDDIWYEEKLIRGIRAIERQKEPLAVYSSAYSLKKERGKQRSDTVRKELSFGNALVENAVTGCAAIFTRELLIRMQQFPEPRQMYMHDWFLYLFASDKGKVIYDNRPSFYYRQHEDNAVGVADGTFQQLQRRLGNRKNLKKYLFAQAREYDRVFSPEESHREITKIFLDRSLWGRLKTFLDRRIYRQKITDHMIYKLFLLFG